MQNNSPSTPENNTIKSIKIKFPFSGVAPNLIDKFLVLGYKQKSIDYYSQFGSENTKYHTRFQFFDLEDRPSVINEICNNYSKDLLDNELILELIFPNLPKMYFMEKKYLNTPKEPDEELLTSPYSIIFSINPQDNSGSKKSYNGLGFVFFISYEPRGRDTDGIFYIPMAYVILSEYPYFYHFNEICRNVYFQMLKENDEIPIDIILYNVVKFAPSPINKNINLYFGGQIGFSQDKDATVETILDTLNIINRKEKGIPSMFFNQLSGYPFMDVNLSFIFNLIPPEIIVEVFIFSFLEHDIIFYSSRPEILNMVMYIFANLNYPFNDSIYYWHLLSVSIDSFMSGSSTFVGKTSSTMTGILDEYNPNVMTTKKIREHFVLDIDNKNFFFLFQEETDEVKDTMDLYTYIKNCASEVDEANDTKKGDKDKESTIRNYFNDGIQLYEVIKNLMEELQRRSKKVTSVNYNNENVKRPSFLNMYDDESEMECMKSNARLQKAFFTFITQIITNFVGILSITEDKEANKNNSESNLNIALSINIKNEKLNEEEQSKRDLARKAGRIFKEKFKDSSKYSSFVVSFCKYHDTIDLYKIPYTFINEFVYYSHVAVKNNLSEVDVFKLIDQFYGKRKMIDFEEFINQKEKEEEEKKDKKDKKEKKKGKEKEDIKNSEEEILNIDHFGGREYEFENIYSFSFNQFTEYYQKYLRANINREQEDDREIFYKVKATNKKYKKYKRNGFYLSQKLLHTYNNYLNNNFYQILDLFKLKKYPKGENKKKSGKNINDLPPASLVSEIDDRIDYFSILKDKKFLKKEKINLSLFGKYEFGEITDVIEKHFISERCFSSYGIIKFSLLNILAITRDIKSANVTNRDVITTMCDFCEKTKSLVRKYMNLYLNIFKNKEKDILDDFCLNQIATYFTKTNMIPTEETTHTITDIKESESKKELKINEMSINDTLNSDSSIIQMLDYDKSRFEDFAKEKGQLIDVKPDDKKLSDFIKTMETIFGGKYKSNINIFQKDKYDKLNHTIYEAIEKEKKKNKGFLSNKENKKNFMPLTPLGLYVSTNKIVQEYLTQFKIPENKGIYIELCEDILSLLYYFRIPFHLSKWMEEYKINDMGSRHINKEKNKKSKETKKENKENKDNKELTTIIKKIIAILFDLYEVVSKMLNNF